MYICGSNEIMKTFDVRYINHPSICIEEEGEEKGDRVAGAYNWGTSELFDYFIVCQNVKEQEAATALWP